MIPMLNATKQDNQNLGAMNQAYLLALSQQGNESLSHGALTEQAAAQNFMVEAKANNENLVIPKVNFFPSRHPDPRKARKHDIKQAYRLLTPAKRHLLNPMRFMFGRKYRYNKETGTCVVDGCDVATLIYHDNLFARITDEDSGLSLWDMYWQNPVTGESEAFIACEKVTNGRKMRGTYCPEHLHLFHLLCKWEKEEDKLNESNPRTLKDRMKRGVSLVTVPIVSVAKKDNTPPMLQKYEQFFAELEKDSRNTNGISIIHHTNPVTGINDTTFVVFDLRIFQHELEQLNQPTEAFQAIMKQDMVDGNPQGQQPLGMGE